MISITSIKGATLGEIKLINKMLTQLAGYQGANWLHEAYYDGSFVVKYLGISIPESAKALKMVSGWATTTVDVLEERLSWQGWHDDTLQEIYHANALESESSQVHLDTLIYGTSYVSVTSGGPGEPPVLIRGHDAKNTVGIYNNRTRRLDAALSRTLDENGEEDSLTLWLADQIVAIDRVDGGWAVTNRQPHSLGRVPMVQQVNRPRTADSGGKSEITKAIRSYTDSAVRALTGMEVNREFFSAPQRYLIGLDEDSMFDDDGRQIDTWKILTGRIWGIPGVPIEDENGEPTGEIDKPQVGEFSPISPGPYLEQISGLATQLAAEAGLPADYLGVHTANPSSADAIQKGEARLIRRTEKRQAQFGQAWDEVGRLTHLILGTENPSTPKSMWMEASTPTLSATTDAMVKAASAGIVPAGSEVVLRRLRFSPEEIRQIQKEMALERSSSMATTLGAITQVSDQARRAARENRDPLSG